jgi:phage head maturation protease
MIDRHDNSEIETASTGSPVERADLRHRQADQALRHAPPWVREKIAAIRGERLADGTVERRSGMEFASEDRATAAVARSAAHAPPNIIRAINRNRRAAGLAEIAVRPEPTGPGVWVRDRTTGQIVPVGSSTPPARPAPRASTPTIRTRVIVLPCPSFTDAPAGNLGTMLPESIAPTAFGRAEELNIDRGFDLRLGHHGPKLAYPGTALRAIDTPHGTVFEWIVDPRMPLAGEALRAVKAGCGVSVGLKIGETRTLRLPYPVTVVTRARLEHVALLDQERPAYPAATAIAFPYSTVGDADELRKQIDRVVAEAQFRWRRAS